MKARYKIGTRGSLLALTQCTQIKDELEKLTGDEFVLEVMKTQGDFITNAPLWQLDGKDFFTKELDHALLNREVDLVVHSYKDLGSVRPEGIMLAAITERKYAHDVLLIKKETLEKLNSIETFIIGTSSPRRMTNLKAHYKNFLPSQSIKEIETKVLRGNVNTRIQKLRDDEYHAIVLALPGLERLASSEKSKLELSILIEGLTFMVLPQTEFPSAAAQGALAIECLANRADNGELLKKLKLVNCDRTVSEVSRERKAFAEYGGGCHLAVGIHVEKRQDFFCHFHRGVTDNKQVHLQKLEDEKTQRAMPQFLKEPKVFIGISEKKGEKFKSLYKNLVFDKYVVKKSILNKSYYGDHIYITSKHCLHALESLMLNRDMNKFIFAAGSKTMRDLAEIGFWVHGSSDGLGDEELKRLRDSKFLNMFYNNHLVLETLSHDKATSSLSEVTPVYTHLLNELSEEYKKEIENTDFFYWTSATEFNFFAELFPNIKNKFHACGLGKTYVELKKHKDLKLVPFLSMKEFEEYLKSLQNN